MKHVMFVLLCMSALMLYGCGPKNDEDFFSDEEFIQETVNELTPQERIEQYKQILEIDPEDYQIRNNLGVVYAQLRLLDEAIEEFKKVLEQKPDYTTAWLNLGSAYGDAGKVDDAIKCYEKAIELKPDYVKGYSNLAMAYYQKNEYQKAIDMLDEYFKNYQGEPDEHIYFILAESYRGLNDKANTVAAYKKVLEINPSNEWVRSQLENIDQVFEEQEKQQQEN